MAECSVFEPEAAVEKLKRYKSPDELPAEVIQAVGETSRYQMYYIFNYIRNEKEFLVAVERLSLGRCRKTMRDRNLMGHKTSDYRD